MTAASIRKMLQEEFTPALSAAADILEQAEAQTVVLQTAQASLKAVQDEIAGYISKRDDAMAEQRAAETKAERARADRQQAEADRDRAVAASQAAIAEAEANTAKAVKAGQDELAAVQRQVAEERQLLADTQQRLADFVRSVPFKV